MRRRFALLLTCALLLPCARDAAAWPPGGVQFERADPENNGLMGLGPDGVGGTYAAWVERDPTGALAFRVHRLDSEGEPPSGWTTAGVRALSPGGFTLPPFLVPDGVGGSYVAWVEGDSAGYVGHLAADGSLVTGWPARGVAVTTIGQVRSVVVADDGAGGVLVAWSHQASGTPSEIVTQRFLADGSRGPGFPAAGRGLTSFANQSGRFRPRLVRDADRGFWISFHTVGNVQEASAYAILHLDPNGWLTPGQPANGRPLSLPNAEIGYLRPYAPVALAVDGVGGVFAFTLGGNGNVRAFHVLSSVIEDPAWPAGGLLLGAGAGWPSVFFWDGDENWPVATADLGGNAWVGWRDQADFLLHATRVQLDGTISPGWANTVPIAGEMRVTMLGDPSGVYASSLAPTDCPHFNCFGPFLLVRMSVDGTLAPGWPPANPPVSRAPGIVVGNSGLPDGPLLVADGTGAVVVGWTEYPEYYAMRFTAAGQLTEVPPVEPGPIGIRARFDPTAGVRVWFSTGELGGVVDLFDVAGHRMTSAPVTTGTGEIALDGTRNLAGGVFFARLSTGAGAVVTKFVVLP